MSQMPAIPNSAPKTTSELPVALAAPCASPITAMPKPAAISTRPIEPERSQTQNANPRRATARPNTTVSSQVRPTPNSTSPRPRSIPSIRRGPVYGARNAKRGALGTPLRRGRSGESPLAVDAFRVSTGAGAALRNDLVDLLVDALVDLRLLGVGLVGGQSASGGCLIDARVRRVLQRRCHVGRALAMCLGPFG